MRPSRATGLGEPEPVGKKSLFQPPVKVEEKEINIHLPESEKNGERTNRRIRTTVSLTNQALVVIQEVQNRYRLETGKVLPLWKLVSQVIETYGQTQKGNSNGKEKVSD